MICSFLWQQQRRLRWLHALAGECHCSVFLSRSLRCQVLLWCWRRHDSCWLKLQAAPRLQEQKYRRQQGLDGMPAWSPGCEEALAAANARAVCGLCFAAVK